MAFFRNRAVNRANLHYGVQAFAEAGGGVFIYVYLLRAGVSVPATLTALAALLAGRFVMRPAVLPFALRFGLKRALIFGTLANAATYLILTRVQGVDLPLAAFTLVAALGGVFYWTCFHAYFAAIGDAEHRGHQISAREALATLLGIVAPLIGGWALVTAGPARTFAAVGLIQALAVLPLIGAPDVAVAVAAPGAFRAARLGLTLFLADGAFAAGYHYVWQIALFISLGESFSAYGGAMALAALVGAACGLLIGRHIDAGLRPPRRSHRLCGGGGRRAHAGRERRLALARRQRQRGRSLLDRAVDAGDDDGALQPGQGVAVSVALPHRHRGRLGHRLRRRLPDRGGTRLGGLSAVGRNPARRAGRRRRRSAALPLLRPCSRARGGGPARLKGQRRPHRGCWNPHEADCKMREMLYVNRTNNRRFRS